MPAVTSDPALVGGRYQLVDVIARGGMGVVWAAHDERLDRPVAVKATPLTGDPAAQELLRRRFLREAHAAARLCDPSAVAVFDSFATDEHLYLVMEFVDAPTLDHLVRTNGPCPVRVAVEYGIVLAGVLDRAHAAGVVHCDVKPANVLVAEGGALKLADFGIARVADDVTRTLTGHCLGSPGFLAPEQATGEPLTPAVDVWGLGATLYFAVEGRAPYEAPTLMAALRAVVDEPLPPARLAGPLSALLAAMLSKRPGDRPSMAAVRSRLRDVGPVAATPVTTVLPAITTAAPVVAVAHTTDSAALRRRPRRVRRGLVAGAVAVLLAVGVMAALARSQSPPLSAPTTTVTTTPSTAPTTVPPVTTAPATAPPPPHGHGHKKHG